MKLNDYQNKAMATCLPSCANEVYAINGLTIDKLRDRAQRNVIIGEGG